MRPFLCALLFCAASFKIFGQDTRPELIPQSPKAYALAKYGDVPVSLMTGIPEINIPIFKLADHSIDVAVSLSYYGAGVKVDEEATDVGLGWTLNAGGSITRVIRGKPDNMNNGVFETRTNIVGTPDNYPSVAAFDSANGLEAASHGGTDNEPDLYIFNFAGRTGKFFFDRFGNVVMQKREDLDIKWVARPGFYGVLDFVIKDEKGNVYTFASHEDTHISAYATDATSAWFLTTITSPAGNTINFEYTGNYLYHYVRANYPTVVILPNNHTTIASGPGSPLDPPYLLNGNTELQVTKISCSAGSIEFNYKSDNRIDCYGAKHALNDIIIFDMHQVPIKKFKLQTSYFEANNDRKYPSSIARFTHLNYRLRLDNIQEFNYDGTVPSSPPHQFHYMGDNDPTTDDPYTLPVRLSPQQDHWGYYNYSNNTQMYPGCSNYLVGCGPWTDIMGGCGGTFFITVAGAYRELDTAATKAGLLRRIDYPTGGYTDFTYEPNYSENYKEGGVRIKSIKDHPLTGNTKEKKFTYSGYSNADPQKSYFQLYSVYYFPVSNSGNAPYFKTSPPEGMLSAWGVPYNVNDPYQQQQLNYVGINAVPQSVLARGANPGYDEVTVTEPGNGRISTSFDNSGYGDYNGEDGFSEGTAAELSLYNGVFQAGYVDDSYDSGVHVFSEYVGSTNWHDWPYPNTVDNSWKRGVVSGRAYFSDSGTILQKEEFNYKRKLLNVVPGYTVLSLRPNSTINYFYSCYGVSAGQILLDNAIKTLYDQNGQNPVSDTTQYYYDNPNHLLATRIETRKSDGKKEVSLTSYPLDYASGTNLIDNMVAGHQLSYPIEQVNYSLTNSGIQIVSGRINQYSTGGKAQIDKVLKLENYQPISLPNYKFSNSNSGDLPFTNSLLSYNPDPRYKTLLNYNNAYDNYGNPLAITYRDAPPVSYQWGYNKLYPVAECKNAGVGEFYYEGFEDAAPGSGVLDYGAHTGHNYILGYTIPFIIPNGRSYVITYWYKLGGVWKYMTAQPYSNYFNLTGGDAYDDVRVYPSDAQMTTYTYDPLVGMTSMTDSKGMTTTYEYDSFQRLMNVKDASGKILKHTDYHYKP